jgi:hypothetical protein
MASLRDLVTKESPNGKASRKIADQLREKYPLIAEILGGVEKNGDQPEISAGTITVFLREGKARFSANVKSAEATFIGEIEDISNPWGSIEVALQTGQVNQKKYTEQFNRLSDDQKKLLL